MRFAKLFATATVCVLAVALAMPAIAGKDEDKWDVTESFGPSETVTISVDEGTWMNLDVSPDGEHIVFDMLGDIYIMSIKGGDATLLAGGLAWECQPRFSPDGKRISFTSDRDGADNIWTMDTDGADLQQVTKEDFRLVNNAVWTPDGEYLVAKKHFTSRRSLGAGEMWLYHTSGGKGYQLTKRKNDQQDVGEPCVSPDGKYVYFSEDMSGGTRFEYNKDPHDQIYMIRCVNRENGKVQNVIRGPGGAVRPQVSPDGEKLSFVRRVRTKSVLYVHDLKTGEETPVWDGLYKDQQETWATFGVYPGYNWMPDNRHIVIWANGKIWKVDTESREAEMIPFRAKAKHEIHQALRFKQDVSPDEFDAKLIRHGVTSPDGKWFVFSAVGHLWKKELPDGKPERLTKDEAHWEYFPAYSPDGKTIVYTTWSDDELGAIRTVNSRGGKGKKITDVPGYYVTPSYSPDGKTIVFRKRAGDYILGFNYGKKPGLYWMETKGGEQHRIRSSGTNPRFSADGERIYYMEGGEKSSFNSCKLDGSGERKIVESKYANFFVPSPDDEWLAFNELFQIYVVAFPQAGRTVTLSGKASAMPLKKVTRDAGTYVHWSGDGERLHWTIGAEYYTRELKDAFTFVDGAADTTMPPDENGIDIGLTLKTDVPDDKFAFTNATIITMDGDKVIDNGTVLVDKNRIVGVGNVDVPSGYETIDCSGKTIMPGIVDVHAHMWHSSSGMSPTQSWMYYANLAFGVTTTHDPSNWTEMVFTHSEMIKAGEMIGPRVYSTGTILYGADGNFKAVVNSLDDARSHLRRMKAQGAFSVKSYNQPRRNQRQQVVKAARELEMMVMPEGGSFFYHNMTMILDGHTGVEHTVPIAPLYDDVIKLWGSSETYNTPTLVVGYGGIWGENYWYQKTDVYKNERLNELHAAADRRLSSDAPHATSRTRTSTTSPSPRTASSSSTMVCMFRLARTDSVRDSVRTGSCGCSSRAA